MRHVQASPVRNQHGIPVSVVNKERMHGRHVVCVLHMLTCRWALWSKTLNPGCIHFGYTSDAQSTRSLGSPDLNGRIARALIMRHEPNMVGAFFAIPTSTQRSVIGKLGLQTPAWSKEALVEWRRRSCSLDLNL
eukprot:scaffold181364_cov21-Tisochrysis_lutea.AAC.1